MIHASPARSRELIDLPKEEVAQILLADFFAATGAAPVAPQHLDAHRWLYALPQALNGEGARFDAALRIGIAGDYLHSPRVEGRVVVRPGARAGGASGTRRQHVVVVPAPVFGEAGETGRA